MQIKYYKQKPKKIRQGILERPNDGSEFLYVAVFGEDENITENGIEQITMGLLYDLSGKVYTVSVDLSYWSQITEDEFYAYVPLVVSKAMQARREDSILEISN